MKNIYKISFIAIIATLFFNSCAIDDDPAIIADTPSITAVSLDKSGEHYIFPSAGNELTVSAVLSQAINDDSLIVLDVNGTEQNLILEAGDTTISISVPNTIGAVNSINLVSAAAVNTNISLGVNTTVKFTSVPEPSEDSINLALNLSDTSGALSIFAFAIFDENSDWVTDIAGGVGTTVELPLNSTIDNSTDISPNYYTLHVYTQALNSPDYTIYAVYPDGSVEVFSGSNLSQDGFTFQDVILVDVTDSSVSGQKDYALTQN